MVIFGEIKTLDFTFNMFNIQQRQHKLEGENQVDFKCLFNNHFYVT